jgi:N-acetyl-gamma-glutamylphosphate reductase
MIGIFKTETLTATGETITGSTYNIPDGKIWRLDKLTFTNQTAARGNFALICVTDGVINYLVPFTAMSTDVKIIDLSGVYLTERDQIYIYITGLTAGDVVNYTLRGFERDIAGVEFIV